MRNFFRALLITALLALPGTAAVTAVTASPAGASWIDTGTRAQGCYWYAYRDNNRTGYFYFRSNFSSFHVSCQFPYRIQCRRTNGSTFWKGTYSGTAYGRHERFPSPEVYVKRQCDAGTKIIRVDVLENQVFSF